MKVLNILILFICISFSVKAQTEFNATKADAYMDLLDENRKFMGVVQLQKGDEIIYERAIGKASLKDSIPNTVDTKFRIGSISKIFTATMVFQLIEEGKLNLDTKLSQYFPKIKNAEEITVKDMLNHSSGISNFTDKRAFLYMMYNDTTQEELLDYIYNLDPDFSPHEKSAYSNTNYLLLSYIIEALDNRGYNESLKNRITNPLNLTDTFYGSQINLKNNEAYSHQYYEAWQEATESSMTIPSGAGAIVSTAKDLNHFIHILLGSNQLLDSESLEQMKMQENNYGHGFFKVPFYEIFGYGHGGAIDGFKTELYYFPTDDLSIAVLSNGISLEINDVLLTLLEIAYDMEVEFPDFKEITILPTELPKYQGTFSTEQFPLKITVSATSGKLVAQATGQGPFPLMAKSRTNFEFPLAGIKMEFMTLEDGYFQEFKFTQGGQSFVFAREN